MEPQGTSGWFCSRMALQFPRVDAVRLLHSPPHLRSGCKAGSPLADSWWGRLPRIFRTGKPKHFSNGWAQTFFERVSPNTVLCHINSEFAMRKIKNKLRNTVENSFCPISATMTSSSNEHCLNTGWTSVATMHNTTVEKVQLDQLYYKDKQWTTWRLTWRKYKPWQIQ